MKPNDYQIWTRSVVIYRQEIEDCYVVENLAGEAGEFMEVFSFTTIQNDTGRWLPGTVSEFEKEAGDICWQVARLADTMEIPFADLVGFAIDIIEKTHVKSYNVKDDVDRIVKCACRVSGIHAKLLRDTKGEQLIPQWTSEAIEKVTSELRLILLSLIRLIHTYKLNIETVLQTNHDKLMSRKNRDVLSGSGDNR